MTIVAIDGPGGSGKSTVACALAERLGVERLDTGAMYRAVTLAALRRSIPPTDGHALGALAREMKLEVGMTKAGGSCASDPAASGRVLLDGEDVTAAIRGDDVNALVSVVAAHPEVREELVARQRAWVAAHGAGVVEGRDITSVVLPDADLKVYLTADPAVRAERRAREVAGTAGDGDEAVDVAAVGEAIERRDRLDSARSASPLMVVDGAIVVDSTGKSVRDVVDEIWGLL
ncbi:MAG: cmk [Acidimicrobiaceae bacterium]|nr:cmk [Acidimicrobiaceae bacterium]